MPHRNSQGQILARMVFLMKVLERLKGVPACLGCGQDTSRSLAVCGRVCVSVCERQSVCVRERDLEGEAGQNLEISQASPP